MGPPNRKTNRSKETANLIEVIKTPLGFYVLALLIVESTLAIVLSCSKLSEDHVWWGFISMIIVLIFVVLIVTGIAMWKPENLLYGKEEHYNERLDPSALKDQIEDLIETNVKAECLKNSNT